MPCFRSARCRSARPRCRVRDLSNARAGVRRVSLSVRRGEILGIAGLVGSGRTQLAETIFGLTPADDGRDRHRWRGRSRSTRRRTRSGCGIGYVPEDRRQHGVVLEMPVAANTSLANLPAVSRRGLIDRGAERARARAGTSSDLRIKTASVDAEVGSLSGGNQQKVALARWLATRPSVLILDEPTQGVDVGSKAEIHRLMQDLAERGMAIIMISSELPEILGMSDRIAVMHAGTIATTIARATRRTPTTSWRRRWGTGTRTRDTGIREALRPGEPTCAADWRSAKPVRAVATEVDH